MKRKHIYVIIICSLAVLSSLSGFAFGTNYKWSPPYKIEKKEIVDGTPVSIRDAEGKIIWQGTAQEYHIIVKLEPQFISNIYRALEAGPEELKHELQKIEAILNRQLPQDQRLPQNYRLYDDNREMNGY